MLPKRRKALYPIMTDGLLCLKKNCARWGIAEVREALHRVKANEKGGADKEKYGCAPGGGCLCAGESRSIDFSGHDVQGVDFGDRTY